MYQLLGHEIQTPFGNAAGSINGTDPENILREVADLSRTPLGYITVGSFTVLPQAGNEATYGGPVFHYDEEAEATYNSMGLPNIGLKAAVELMPDILRIAERRGKLVVASISPSLPTPETGNTLEQIEKLLGELSETGVPVIQKNSSCPNKITADGGRDPMMGYDPDAMIQSIEMIDKMGLPLQLAVLEKMPPYLTSAHRAVVPEIGKAIRYSKAIDGVVACNTIPGCIPTDKNDNPIFKHLPGNAGGMSGPATVHVGREETRRWVDLLGDRKTVISAEGVHDGHEAAIRLQLGANAVEGVSFLWNSSNWARAVHEMVSEWSEVVTEA